MRIQIIDFYIYPKQYYSSYNCNICKQKIYFKKIRNTFESAFWEYLLL